MGDGATDGAAVTHLRVAHVAGGVGQQRHVLGQQRAVLHIHVPGEGTDGDVVAGIADVRQVGDTTDVDQHAGLGDAQLHHRQQAVATGEELGIVAVLTEEADGLFGRTGTDVIECCGDHLVAPCWADVLTD